MTNGMNAQDRITTAKVRLQKENPFYSHLCMSLKPIEKKEIGTAGVDVMGNLYYNPEWIEKLNNDECKTLLAHEVMHIALLHLTRGNGRDERIFNVANDIVINNLLVESDFKFSGELLKGCVPSRNEIVLKDLDNLKITQLSEKMSEEVYALIYKKMKEKQKQQYGFDVHIYSDGKGNNEGKDGNGKSIKIKLTDGNGNEIKLDKASQEKLENEWRKKLADAITYAKTQGKLPASLERYADEILNNKLNWRELLYRYIQEEVPYDYSWARASKKSQACGLYLPKVKKDGIDVTCFCDVSGSIGQKELNDFVSELKGISNAFESVRIHLIFWDTEAHERMDLTKGEIAGGDLDKLKFSGGGGTDFTKIYDYMERENLFNTKLLIFFTDGYADFPSREEYKTMWVLSQNGIANKEIPFGMVARLDNSGDVENE